MAPEQFLSPTSVSPAADVFSLGCLLVYAATGHSPFDADNPHVTAYQIVHEQPRLDGVPAWLLPLVTMCLAKESGDRPTPAGLLEALTSTSTAVTAAPNAAVRYSMLLRGRPARLVLSWAVLAGLLTAGFLIAATPQEPHHRTERPGASPSTPDLSTLPPGLSTDVSVYRDPDAGFQLLVHNDLRPKGTTPEGQVWFEDDDEVDMVVAPGLDTVERVGEDLEKYQRLGEPELREYRDSKTTAMFGVDELDLNGSPAIKGEFSWRDEKNVEFYARNLVILHDGKYHVVLVKGPKRDRSEISQYFEKAAGSYRVIK